MNFEDIGRVWREEPSGEFKRRRIEHLSTVLKRADGFLNSLHHRGKRTFAVTVALAVPVLMWGVINAPRPRLAAPGVLMVWIWLAVMWLRWRRLRPPPPDSTQPVRIAVQAEVTRLRFLERFWGKVSWGMMALFVVGEVLAFEGFRPIGADRGVVSFFFYTLLIVGLALVVFRNPVIARHKVRPLREDLESWLEGLEALESGHPPDTSPKGGTA